MADDEKDLKIGIKVAADLAGATAAEGAIKKVGDAANNAARETAGAAHESNKATESMGEAGKKAGHDTAEASSHASTEVKELGHSFHEGAQAGRVIAEVAEGNIGALAHLGTAIKSLSSLLKTNLIGTLFTLGAVAAQIIIPMVKGFKSVEEEVKKAAEEADKLAKIRMDTLARELGVAGQAADDLRKKFEQAQASKERLDNAEQAARLAEVRNNTSLTEVDKAKAESAIKEEFRLRAQLRKIDDDKNKITVAQQREGSARQSAVQPERDLKEAISTLDELREKQRPFDELARLQRQTGGTRDEAFARGERIADLSKELAGKKPIDPRLIQSAEERVAKATEPVDAVRAKIAEAERQVSDSKFDLANEQTVQGKENTLVQRERRSDLGASLKVARGKDEERADTIRAAREKLTSNDDAKTKLDAELRQLEDQLTKRPGLSDDPRNAALAASIAKKKEEIAAVGGQRSALDASLQASLKEAPKSIVARSQQPALDAQTRDAIATKENTAALIALTGALASIGKTQIGGKSEAAPGTFLVNGQVHQTDTGAGGPKITKGDGTAVPVTPFPTGPLKIQGQDDAGGTAVGPDGANYTLDKVTGALVKQGAALKGFSDAAVSELSAQAKDADRHTRQIANLR